MLEYNIEACSHGLFFRSIFMGRKVFAGVVVLIFTNIEGGALQYLYIRRYY